MLKLIDTGIFAMKKTNVLYTCSIPLILIAINADARENYLDKFETYQPPIKKIEDYRPTLIEIANDSKWEDYKKIENFVDYYEKQRNEWVNNNNDGAYFHRKKDCGGNSVPPTMKDVMVYDLVNIAKKDSNIKNENNINIGDIKNAIQYVYNNDCHSITSIMPWKVSNYIKNLNSNELNLMAVDVFDYIQSNGVKSGSYETIEKTNKDSEKKLLENYFNNQIAGKSGAGYFCNDLLSKPVDFYSVTKWEVVDYNDTLYDYNVRIHSSTKGGFPIIKTYNVDLSIKSRENCVIEWCLREISSIDN